MNSEKNYTYYRNKRVPMWWIDYLPEERNPYRDSDTLTLEKGCLEDYWHIHSSNKHPNYRGAEACNYVHELVKERFGAAFLSGHSYWGGRQGEHLYHEPEHLVYENAFLGEDDKIHIKNAKRYYEDVTRFVMKVLSEIAKNHMQSGFSSNAGEFFPYLTDQEIERNRQKAEIQRANTLKLKETTIKYMQDEAFCIDSFECDDVSFDAVYTPDDDWFNAGFKFVGMHTNIDSENERVGIIVNFPNMYHADSKKKDRSLATKELSVDFCLYLRRTATMDAQAVSVTLTISTDKVSDDVKQKIGELCNKAMEEYNKKHIDLIENTACTPVYRYYPHNIFLDNRIGNLNLIYKDGAGMFSWRRYNF